ncbi:MAG TPA: hypothetical protein VH475_02195 [Tepidisphaeraceae bacterium]|jgi:hypothetical protein
MNPRSLLAAIAALGLLMLTGCVGVPLGDPAVSKADSRYCGVFEWRDAHVNRAVIRAWDQRTYVVDVLTGDFNDDGTTRPRSRSVFKAWLTEVEGRTFMTLQPIELVGVLNGDDRHPMYLIARLTLDGQTLTAAPIDPDFKKLKDITTSKELERTIAANVNDPKLYANNPIAATRWTPDQMKNLEKLQETFREYK